MKRNTLIIFLIVFFIILISSIPVLGDETKTWEYELVRTEVVIDNPGTTYPVVACGDYLMVFNNGKKDIATFAFIIPHIMNGGELIVGEIMFGEIPLGDLSSVIEIRDDIINPTVVISVTEGRRSVRVEMNRRELDKSRCLGTRI